MTVFRRSKEAEIRKAKSKAAKFAKLDPNQAQTALQIQQEGRNLSKQADSSPEIEEEANSEDEQQIAEVQAPRSQKKQTGRDSRQSFAEHSSCCVPTGRE